MNIINYFEELKVGDLIIVGFMGGIEVILKVTSLEIGGLSEVGMICDSYGFYIADGKNSPFYERLYIQTKLKKGTDKRVELYRWPTPAEIEFFNSKSASQ